MIVLDANLLLYAYDSASPLHGKAKAWLEGVLSGAAPVGIPWQSAAAFVRIVTNPKLPGPRYSLDEAALIIDSWIEQPNVSMLAPGERHWLLYRQMLLDGQARGPLASDAHLAAIAIEHGGVLFTTDRDFARFPGLRWKNPLV
jgi:toxin-antitoxin system PIN domain toxin